MGKVCDKYDELIEPLVTGELDSATAREVMAHIERCRVCREKYEAALAVEKFLTPTDSVVPPGFAKAVASTISARAQENPAPEYAAPEWGLVFGWILVMLGILYSVIAAFRPHIFPVVKVIKTAALSLFSNPVLVVVVGILLVAATFSTVFSLFGVSLLIRRY